MSGMVGAIVRFIVSAIVLIGIGYIVPGFSMVGFGNALLAAIVIAVLGYIVEAIFGEKISPQSRGLVGFITSAVVIYLTQFVVEGLSVTIIGALLAAFVIGLVDAFVPTELR
ncbi:MAG: phage holin family protein [Halanaerobiales bacterium]|jgi:putative membrane protein|nr:phage holin family protein [Halanaerobiales bacterium]HPZ63675.1 phage holin family protein [Halanaerobiales bacterium]HQD04932.1 phage holin family protein [Halanaerobiales bacterium]